MTTRERIARALKQELQRQNIGPRGLKPKPSARTAHPSRATMTLTWYRVTNGKANYTIKNLESLLDTLDVDLILAVRPREAR